MTDPALPPDPFEPLPEDHPAWQTLYDYFLAAVRQQKNPDAVEHLLWALGDGLENFLHGVAVGRVRISPYLRDDGLYYKVAVRADDTGNIIPITYVHTLNLGMPDELLAEDERLARGMGWGDATDLPSDEFAPGRRLTWQRPGVRAHLTPVAYATTSRGSGTLCVGRCLDYWSSMPTLTERLTERRSEARSAADAILTRAADDGRDLTPDELAEHGRQVLAEREAGDALDRARDEQIADLRAGAARGGPILSRGDIEADQAFRSALLEKNPTPIEIRAEQARMFSQPGLEQRDLLKSTATQAMPVSVYDHVVAHMVENSAVMAAGATVINTATGEDLQVPKSTAFSTAALITEGSSITESDATVGISTLKAYKFAGFFQVSQELANDSASNLLAFLAKQAGTSLATAFGPYLITGTGSSQPQGIVTGASVGKTGPTGTATSLGTQATAGQGTDVLYDLIGSVAEPYPRQAAASFIMTNASLMIARKLKDSVGQPVTAASGAPNGDGLLGYPAFVDPNVAAMAANAKSVIFGDLSRYFVRIAGGIRFERSDDFAFQNDLVSFKVIVRLDGALVDANGIKLFQNSAT